MYATTATNTSHHPRGSGPAYGIQFQRLAQAWYRLREYGQPPFTATICGDVEMDTYLSVATTRKEAPESIELTEERPSVADFYGVDTIAGPQDLASIDELLRWWWEHHGQYNSHPWDPNGIVTSRRLGLTRATTAPEDWLGDSELDAMHETDKLTFEAYDRGDFEREPQEAIWNRVNRLGFQWDVPAQASPTE